MSPPAVAIVGAGIGGLTAALVLAASGCPVTVLERRTGFGETGAGIQLSPNASRILVRLGLGGALRRVVHAPDSLLIRDLRSGRALGSVPLAAAAARYGAPYWLAARQDLHAVLLDAVRSRPEVTLRVGRSLEGFADEPDGVRYRFRGAGEVEEGRAGLLVGADGIGSRMRALLGDTRPLRSARFVAYRATLPGAPAEPRQAGLWLGPDRHVVVYPVGADARLNVVAVTRGTLDTDGWSTPAEASLLRATFRDAAPDLAALLAGAESWTAWPLRDLPVRVLAQGQTALVGDAAHPTLPFAAQGAGLAIEDAAALGTALASAGSVESALARYAAGRSARIAAVQTLARRNATAYHASGPVAAIRNLVMARLGPAGMLARYDWVYGWGGPAPA